jgi:hypothetical protein
MNWTGHDKKGYDLFRVVPLQLSGQTEGNHNTKQSRWLQSELRYKPETFKI